MKDDLIGDLLADARCEGDKLGDLEETDGVVPGGVEERVVGDRFGIGGVFAIAGHSLVVAEEGDEGLDASDEDRRGEVAGDGDRVT